MVKGLARTMGWTSSKRRTTSGMILKPPNHPLEVRRITRWTVRCGHRAERLRACGTWESSRLARWGHEPIRARPSCRAWDDLNKQCSPEDSKMAKAGGSTRGWTSSTRHVDLWHEPRAPEFGAGSIVIPNVPTALEGHCRE